MFRMQNINIKKKKKTPRFLHTRIMFTKAVKNSELESFLLNEWNFNRNFYAMFE